MTADVSLNTINHSFGSFEALKNIDLTFGEGEFVVLLGPSGCGKSTLLFILGGFLTPTGGTVTIGGKTWQALRPRTGQQRRCFRIMPCFRI
jgi:spermidine/putrescine transport system ATP-binding protein